MAINLQHNVLVTTSVAGEQVIHSLTVAGSPVTMKILTIGAAYTAWNATEAYLGFARFQIDAGLGGGFVTTDRSPAFVNTDLDNNNPMIIRPLGAGHVIAVGEGIRAICNPATTTSIRWACSMWGES